MTTFRLDPDGDGELLLQLARGFAEFGEEAAGEISQLAPRNTGRYARSIQSTTFLENGVYSGQPVRGHNIKSNAQIWTLIWTADPRGHLFELGTKARTITSPGWMAWAPDKYSPSGGLVRPGREVHQPGMTRRPHFWPGFVAVVGRAGEIIGHGARTKRTRINTRVLP